VCEWGARNYKSMSSSMKRVYSLWSPGQPPYSHQVDDVKQLQVELQTWRDARVPAGQPAVYRGDKPEVFWAPGGLLHWHTGSANQEEAS